MVGLVKMMIDWSKVLKGVFGALLFLWFLYAGIVKNHATTTITTSTDSQMLNHWKFNGRYQSQASNLIYDSKRRVPNGPDPIHNRRAVNNRQPPGRA